MIKGLDHLAINVSTEEAVTFYRFLGFKVTSREERPHKGDVLLFMEGFGIVLEIFVDSRRPKRLTGPEALGLRHLALRVDDVGKTVESLCASYPFVFEDIREINGVKFVFTKDPDGLPIELHE